MGHAEHRVVQQGVTFLKASVRPNGSWPIDTNLATWVTTLSVNALRIESLSPTQTESIGDWLLQQQHQMVHRYTNADPGGWAWTDLSGGVPDADDTPGAILALLKLKTTRTDLGPAIEAGIHWLLDLQNRDGGWPTFCRGWGALPFDRSTPDLTAHAIRALRQWQTFQKEHPSSSFSRNVQQTRRIEAAISRGFVYLSQTQRTEGTWYPLWFGNQFSADEENPVYGVSRVLAAYRDTDRLADKSAKRALVWLASAQNSDGGWGGSENTPSSTEETALAVEALLPMKEFAESTRRGLQWLIDRVELKTFQDPAPIGLYFAKLWYFERLYPIIFTVSALARALEHAEADAL